MLRRHYHTSSNMSSGKVLFKRVENKMWEFNIYKNKKIIYMLFNF